MRRPPFAPLAILATLVLLPLAPLPAGATTGPAASPGTTAVAPLGQGAALTQTQVIAALAAEGVGTYAGPSSTTPLQPVTGPAVPIHVLQAQAALYANESVTGGGTLGSAVSSLLPMPPPPAGKVYAPFDYLLAAYATRTTTPGEVLAGKLLGKQDWTHPDTIVFPDLVLVLFSADAVQAVERAAPAGAGAPLVAPSGTLCATLADWVSQGFNSVFHALTLGSSTTPVLNFLTGIWNSGVALAQSAISNIATALAAPVLTVIRTSLGVIGVVSWAISTLRNLKVTSKATPAFNSFGIDPAPAKTGTLVLTVGNDNGFDWPASVTKCAADLGQTLPSLNSVVGKTVTWTLTPVNGAPTSSWCTGTSSCSLATEDASGTGVSLAADHTATFAYATNTESADQQARGSLITSDYALVRATVSLNTAALIDMVRGMVLGAVPGGVQVVVGPLFDSLTAGILQQIAGLAQPTMIRYIQIEHHQTPGLLPARSCKGLFTAADFPGIDVTLPPSDVADGGTDCYFTNQDSHNPEIAGVYLWVFSSPTVANTFYATEISGFGGSPVAGIGDEAYVGTACAEGKCGPAGAVRVANDVLETSEANVSVNESDLLSTGVTALCPKCQFPTSPPP